MFLSVLIGSGKSRFLFFVTTKLLIVSLLTLESVPLGDPLLPLQELCGMHLISKLRVCMGPAVFSAGNVFLLLSHALDVFWLVVPPSNSNSTCTFIPLWVSTSWVSMSCLLLELKKKFSVCGKCVFENKRYIFMYIHMYVHVIYVNGS